MGEMLGVCPAAPLKYLSVVILPLLRQAKPQPGPGTALSTKTANLFIIYFLFSGTIEFQRQTRNLLFVACFSTF